MPLWHTPLETFGGHLGYRSKYYRAYINLVNWRDKNETPEPEQTHDVSLTSIPEPLKEPRKTVGSCGGD